MVRVHKWHGIAKGFYSNPQVHNCVWRQDSGLQHRGELRRTAGQPTAGL
jgi:hypothetical protein